MQIHRNSFGVLLIIFCLLMLQAHAELITFTLDQTQSSLTLSGNVSGSSFAPQGTGSLVTSYTGTIQTDLAATAITFVGGSLMAGAHNGMWQPNIGGAAGSAPANYGVKVMILGFVPAYAAIRNMFFDVTNSVTTITAGAFSATNLLFFPPPAASPAVTDYRYSSFLASGSGNTLLTGPFTNSTSTNATVITQNGELVITLPVDIAGVTTALQPNDLHYRLVGKLVAKSPVPVRITSFQLSGNQATFTMDTTPGRAYSILGSVDLTNWAVTNDQFTATVTNTSRTFNLPSPALTTQQYYRVRRN